MITNKMLLTCIALMFLSQWILAYISGQLFSDFLVVKRNNSNGALPDKFIVKRCLIPSIICFTLSIIDGVIAMKVLVNLLIKIM